MTRSRRIRHRRRRGSARAVEVGYGHAGAQEVRFAGDAADQMGFGGKMEDGQVDRRSNR